MSNMFDIKNKKTQEKIIEKKTYEKKTHTSENIRELLIGYTEVPPSQWKEIPVVSHIRYVKKDGTFVRGGFVINNDNGVMQLANNLNKQALGYTAWFASHASLSKIYKKGAAESHPEEIKVETNRQTDIIRQMNKLIDAVKQQKTRLDTQEIELKRLQQVVKKITTN